MQEKEVCLKKVFDVKTLILIFVFIYLSLPVKSNENQILENVVTYLNSLDEFSSSFLQIQNNEVSEGLIFVKGNRLKIEYTSPTHLIFILKESKGMYFNKELKEVQYFNTKKTIGKFLIDIFNNDNFLLDSKITKKKSYFILQKEIYLDDTIYNIKIYFEKKPLQLRKLEIINDTEITTFTILNPDYNPNLDDQTFSLANPLLS